VASDLPAGNFAVVGDTDFVGDVFLGELLLGLADEGDLRNGVYAIGIAGGVGVYVQAESARGGDAALDRKSTRLNSSHRL